MNLSFLMTFLLISVHIHAAFSSFSPPITIPTAGNSASPQVGVDGSGNAVIVFIDELSGEFQVRASQLVNGVPTNPYTFPLSANATSAQAPNVAVNPSGNAIASWREQNSSFDYQNVGSFFFNGVWSAPQVFSNIATEFVINYSTPGVSIDDSGNGLVVWAQSVGASNKIQWTQLVSQVWLPEQTIFSSTDFLLTPALSSNHAGKALAAWFNLTGSIVQAAQFNGVGWTVTSFPTSNIAQICGLPQLSVSMNPSGDAVIAWMNNNSPNLEIQAVRLVNGLFGPQQIVSDPSQGSVLFQGAALDPAGNGFVIWTIINTTLNTTSIQVARLFNGVFQSPVTIGGPYDLSTTFLQSPEVVVDAQGDALATWELDDARQAFGAIYSISNGTWSQPFLLSNVGQDIQGPNVATNSAGQATVVWNEGDNPPNLVVQAVIGAFNSIPFSPSNFTGTRRSNRFLTQTDYINRLQWNPSQDPTVVGYFLYRNGQLIASIPASGPFQFEDHNRKKKEIDVYSLTSVNANGVQSSPPLVITVQ